MAYNDSVQMADVEARCAPTAETVTVRNSSNLALSAPVQTLHTAALESLEHLPPGHARLSSLLWKVMNVGEN